MATALAAPNSLATGVDCNRVEAFWILWKSKQDDWEDLRDLQDLQSKNKVPQQHHKHEAAPYTLSSRNGEGSSGRARHTEDHPGDCLQTKSRSKCKCLHSHKIQYFVSLKNTSQMFKKPCYVLNECSFRGTELIDRLFIYKCSHRWRQNQSCLEKSIKNHNNRRIVAPII